MEFRPERGTIDVIFIVKQIIEKAKEHKVPLDLNFLEFKADFDTLWKKGLWKMIIAIGVHDRKIGKTIESLYNYTECAVANDGHLTTSWCRDKAKTGMPSLT